MTPNQRDPNPYPGSRFRPWVDTHKVPTCECGKALVFEDGTLVCSDERCPHRPKGATRYSILKKKVEQ